MAEPAGSGRRRRGMLGGRLLLPRLATGLLLSVVVFCTGMRAISSHFEEEARRRAESVVHAASIVAEKIDEQGELQRIVAAHGADRDVDRIVIVGGSPPRVIASTRVAWQGELLDRLGDGELGAQLAEVLRSGIPLGNRGRPAEHGYRVIAPLLMASESGDDGDFESGAIAVELGENPERAALLRSAGYLVAGLVALVLVLTSLDLWQLRRLVTRPLSRIAAALDRRAAGDCRARVPVVGDDEIAALATTINELVDTISESDARFRQLAGALDDVIWLFEGGREPRFGYVSPAYERVFGRPRGENGVDPSAWVEAVHPEDRDRMLALSRSRASEPQEVEYRIVRPDGDVRWLRSRIFPVLDEQGAPLRIAGVTSDVTVQKEQARVLEESANESRLALQDLRVAQDRSRAILAAIPDVLLEVTPDGIYVDYRAQRAEELFLPPEKVLGRSIAEVVPAENLPRVMQAMEESRRTGEVRPVEYAIAMRGGVQHFEARYSWCSTGNCLVTVRNITQRKEVEQAMHAAREEAEAASQAKSEFLATMSHEIRTPMNAVIGMTGLLLDGPLELEQREYAELIRASGEALLTLINDILDFSKIEAGKLSIESGPFDLFALIEGVTGVLSERAASHGNALHCQIDADVPPHVLGDAGRLRQVLLNLVGNAVKFTREGQVAIHVSREGGDADPPCIRFEVQDTGPGIPEEIQPQLFQEFTQADASTTRRFGGSGLGLAISKRLTELMGGEIGLCSRPGVGSTFWLTLPLPLAKNEWTEAAASHPASRSPEPLGLRVLVAEDNAVNQRLALALLRKLGCRADAVANGREAVEALNRARYDVVLMDCQMPEMDGYEAAREIRLREGEDRHIPIVALTANALRGDRERCLEAGMQDHVSKPVRIEELRTALEPFSRDRSEA